MRDRGPWTEDSEKWIVESGKWIMGIVEVIATNYNFDFFVSDR